MKPAIFAWSSHAADILCCCFALLNTIEFAALIAAIKRGLAKGPLVRREPFADVRDLAHAQPTLMYPSDCSALANIDILMYTSIGLSAPACLSLQEMSASAKKTEIKKACKERNHKSSFHWCNNFRREKYQVCNFRREKYQVCNFRREKYQVSQS